MEAFVQQENLSDDNDLMKMLKEIKLHDYVQTGVSKILIDVKKKRKNKRIHVKIYVFRLCMSTFAVKLIK